MGGEARQLRARQLSPAPRRTALCGCVPHVPAAGPDGDHRAADHRLSHRLWNGAGSGPGAACAAASGHAAVLDQLPDPRLCLDRHPEAGGPAELRAARAGRDRRAAGDHEHRVGGADRARLLLSAVHAPATLRGARSDRAGLDRGRAGSRRASLEGVLARHRAAFHAGCRRRVVPRLHSRTGRVRDPRPAWRLRHGHDRQPSLERVLRQSGLAARLLCRHRPARRDRRPDPGLWRNVEARRAEVRS